MYADNLQKTIISELKNSAYAVYMQTFKHHDTVYQ